MGVTHDKGTTRTCGSTDYRHGYRSPDATYRSILAYSCATSQCDNMPKDGCARRQFFSTPDPNYLYNGSPQGWGTNDAADTAGVGETNNAKKINDVAAHIAAFYDDTQAPSPTNPPTLPQPSSSPTTATPTSSPTTKAPIVCSLANVGESCRDGGDCCSGSCSGGKPSRRTCLSTEPAPSPSEGTTPTAPSTPTPPSFSCGGNKSTCSSNLDCCSMNCKSGQCKGGR